MDAMTETATDIDGWQLDLGAAVCDACDWTYLAPRGRELPACPHCFQDRLDWVADPAAGLPYLRPPELALPFALSTAQIEQAIAAFARGIPFPPQDLNPAAIKSRLRRLYLPMWLVDAAVQAEWRAEAGFDYQVVSHQEQYEQNRGGWSTRQVVEGRVRWEPRLGRLQRGYENVAAPALEAHRRLMQALGKFDLERAVAYQPAALEGALVRLPDRLPQDAWSEAQPAFQAAAAEECRQAAGAQHIRRFEWQPTFENQHWTLLLLPVYSAYYEDDARQSLPLWLNGQSGRINGMRRASMRRARQFAFGLLGLALLVFLLSLVGLLAGVAIPGVMVVAVLGLTLALILGVGALAPLISVWWFNRQERS